MMVSMQEDENQKENCLLLALSSTEVPELEEASTIENTLGGDN